MRGPAAPSASIVTTPDWFTPLDNASVHDSGTAGAPPVPPPPAAAVPPADDIVAPPTLTVPPPPVVDIVAPPALLPAVAAPPPAPLLSPIRERSNFTRASQPVARLTATRAPRSFKLHIATLQ